LGEIRGVPFQTFRDSKKKISLSQAVVEIDKGRFLQFLITFDDFENYEEGRFNSISSNGENSGQAISKQIETTINHASKEKGFIEGMTLVVGCGWGRAVMQPMTSNSSANWSVEFISASDFQTLSFVPKMNPLTFWRLVNARNRLKAAGITIQNLNGLLNLYGWAESNKFHIVPHEQIPKDLNPLDLSSFFLMIEQNSLLDVRSKVLNGLDRHCEETHDGKIILVQRLSTKSYYKKDQVKPIYASLDDIGIGQLLGLINGKLFKWWCKANLPGNENRDFIFGVWEGLCSWIYHLAPLIEPLVCSDFKNHISWDWTFQDRDFSQKVTKVPSYEEMTNLTTTKVRISNECLVISSIFKPGFIHGFHQETNCSEKALIRSLIYGVLLKTFSTDKLEKMVEKTVSDLFTNPDGKSVHMLKAYSFIDFVKESLPKPLFVDLLDDATHRIGIGWLARNPTESATIEGIDECNLYLQKLVDAIWLEIQAILKKLNKSSTVKKLLNNHEALDSDTEHWTRTIKASLGLHQDKENVYSVVVKQLSMRNAGSLGSRLSLEMAICECDNIAGNLPGKLDITKLITYTNCIFHFGGLSDAIKYEMIPAKIRIAPTGDVLFDQTFKETIIDPYGSKSQGAILKHNIKDYSKYFKKPAMVKSTSDFFENEFKIAWAQEYGFDIDEGRKIIDFFENEGIERKKAVFEIEESELAKHATKSGINNEVFLSFCASFTLQERPHWANPPKGYSMNDILPWRFRRLLSSISRPIIKIDQQLYLAPGLIRKGFIYMIRNCYEASFEDSQFKTKAMRKWIGNKRNTVGHQFNKDVASSFLENGWRAESDVFLTKLLNKKLDKNYGDVDVVAWNPNRRLVYLIECKNLEFAKTEGEIARQIYDFRGVINEKGKPDRLKRHLERIQVVSDNINVLKKYLRITGEVTIKPTILFSRVVPLSFVSPDKLNGIKIQSFDQINKMCQ
jgi:hypothetical protein